MEDLKTTLNNNGKQFDAELTAIFQKPHLTTPFRGLHSEFLRKKFYKEEMKLLVSALVAFTTVILLSFSTPKYKSLLNISLVTQ